MPDMPSFTMPFTYCSCESRPYSRGELSTCSQRSSPRNIARARITASLLRTEMPLRIHVIRHRSTVTAVSRAASWAPTSLMKAWSQWRRRSEVSMMVPTSLSASERSMERGNSKSFGSDGTFSIRSATWRSSRSACHTAPYSSTPYFFVSMHVFTRFAPSASRRVGWNVIPMDGSGAGSPVQSSSPASMVSLWRYFRKQAPHRS
mmetsp:Transcript_61502/g.124829  ORF Transcript_61502/g.124829 Transcript_61502/m.124829 type:complete len:204 (+) Transcript_61502:1119-1730(+)